jgi:hypothetical protein
VLGLLYRCETDYVALTSAIIEIQIPENSQI